MSPQIKRLVFVKVKNCEHLVSSALIEEGLTHFLLKLLS